MKSNAQKLRPGFLRGVKRIILDVVFEKSVLSEGLSESRLRSMLSDRLTACGIHVVEMRQEKNPLTPYLVLSISGMDRVFSIRADIYDSVSVSRFKPPLDTLACTWQNSSTLFTLNNSSVYLKALDLTDEMIAAWKKDNPPSPFEPLIPPVP
jgi:hypothetical protein